MFVKGIRATTKIRKVQTKEISGGLYEFGRFEHQRAVCPVHIWEV